MIWLDGGDAWPGRASRSIQSISGFAGTFSFEGSILLLKLWDGGERTETTACFLQIRDEFPGR